MRMGLCLNNLGPSLKGLSLIGVGQLEHQNNTNKVTTITDWIVIYENSWVSNKTKKNLNNFAMAVVHCHGNGYYINFSL